MFRRTLLNLATTPILLLAGCSTDPVVPDDGGTASGTVKLVVSIDGSRTQGTGIVETKTVLASGTLSFQLPSTTVEVLNGFRSVNWDNKLYNGSTFWSEEHLKTYECNSVSVTDRELDVMEFNSSTHGAQPGGAILNIEDDGSYTLGVVALLSTLFPGTSVNETWLYCPAPSYNKLESTSSIPFIQYFQPFTGGLMGSFVGTINSASPNSVKGSFTGADSLVVFSLNTTNTTIPINYTVTWDITISK